MITRKELEEQRRKLLRQEVIPERVLDQLKWHNQQEKRLLGQLVDQERDLIQIANLVSRALVTDGAHHKQWFLAQIGVLCGLMIDFEEVGAIAP